MILLPAGRLGLLCESRIWLELSLRSSERRHLGNYMPEPIREVWDTEAIGEAGSGATGRSALEANGLLVSLWRGKKRGGLPVE